MEQIKNQQNAKAYFTNLLGFIPINCIYIESWNYNFAAYSFYM